MSQPVLPPQLLSDLYSYGAELAASDDGLLQLWGKHLLEDWRSLDLLLQRYEEVSQFAQFQPPNDR